MFKFENITNKDDKESLVQANAANLTELQNAISTGNTELGKEIKAEMDKIQAQIDLIDSLGDTKIPQKGMKQADGQKDSVKAFADAARHRFQNTAGVKLNEGDGADGGYTVPEDIETRINKYRDAKKSLRTLVRATTVTTNSGKSTFKVRSNQSGLSKTGEGATGTLSATPTFERKDWSVEKYTGFYPATEEVLEDSDENLVNLMIEWIGEDERVTDNKLILADINKKTRTAITDIDDIKKVLNITLGQAFKPTSSIITNDSGLQYLDTLKDNDDKYLLSASPADPMRLVLSAGATTIPVEVFPNADIPNTDVYETSTDETVTSGKTYYTRTGSGTAESPYVYTAVEEPTGNPSTSSYYEKTKYQVPFIIGDLKEYMEIKDRKGLTISYSTNAVVGSLNAFTDGLAIWKAVKREGTMIRDSEAIVNGYKELTY